jgi:hypothetical protein
MYLTNIGFDSRATLSANSSIISLYIYLTIRWIGQIQLWNCEIIGETCSESDKGCEPKSLTHYPFKSTKLKVGLYISFYH